MISATRYIKSATDQQSENKTGSALCYKTAPARWFKRSSTRRRVDAAPENDVDDVGKMKSIYMK